MTRSPAERRRHPRKPAEVSGKLRCQDTGRGATLITHNLSMGGAYCTSTVDFPEMTRLAVRLALPGGNPEEKSIDVEAVVVRSERVVGEDRVPRYRLALFFTGLADGAEELLQQYLCSEA